MTHPNSIKQAKANAKRFWTDPELIRRNIEGRKSERFRSTHTGASLHTKEVRAKCEEGKRNSELYWEARRHAGRVTLQTPEVRAKATKARMASPTWPETVRKRIEAQAASPKCRTGSLIHIACREWHLRSPNNVEYHFVNLSEFIRTHATLFDPMDLDIRAQRGLGMIRPSDTRKKVAGTWKGWTWISVREVFANNGKDLLDRKQT